MQVNGKHYRTIWISEKESRCVQIIDQRKLPFSFEIENICSVQAMADAIREMHLRGAGLIGAAGAYGMYLATLEATSNANSFVFLESVAYQLKNTRPTAVNLAWAVDRMLNALKQLPQEKLIEHARNLAQTIANEDANACQQIGQHGFEIVRAISQQKKGDTVNILTHCNAGWLAFVDYGSALAPIYEAQKQGIDVHVWVDETRPRNQGARLTAWELQQQGIKHTIIPDNTGGHLMQKGRVDMVIVGSDRTTRTGDVANKIGTYLKALAAFDNHIPFYVALPSSTIDWRLSNGLKEIPIEERNGEEVSYIDGFLNGKQTRVLLTPESSPAANYGFDVTPARLVSGLITERGICAANEQAILNLFPEHGTSS